MKRRLRSFNLYLSLLAIIVVAGGCDSIGGRGLNGKSEYSTLRLYLESLGGGRSGGQLVYVTRDKIPMYVDADPFLTEEDLASASLVDFPDGTYAIRIQFNDHGKLVLDMTTTASQGRKMVIFSQFPPPGWKESKTPTESGSEDVATGKPRVSAWLSVKLINGGMSEGGFEFTPDASHAEAVRIVKGLNNMVTAIDKMEK